MSRPLSFLLPLLGCLLLIACQAPLKQELTLVSFNIRFGAADDGPNSWPNRRGMLFSCLEQMQPDILGVQEALPFQIREILVQFPNWKMIGVGRYHGIEIPERPHESGDGEMCAIFYDSTRLSLKSHGTFWHSDTPDTPGSMSWGNDLPRITTWGIFADSVTGTEICVLNTHFHWGEPYRSRATALLRSKIGEISRGLPVVLMGDFNADPHSAIHDSLLAASDAGLPRLQDPFLTSDSLGVQGTFHGFTGTPQSPRIDWILLSSEWQPLQTEIVTFSENRRYPSDHFPVRVVARLQ